MVTEDSKILLHRFNWQRLWTISPGKLLFTHFVRFEVDNFEYEMVCDYVFHNCQLDENLFVELNYLL